MLLLRFHANEIHAAVQMQIDSVYVFSVAFFLHKKKKRKEKKW